MAFKKAQLNNAKARIALEGPAGSGKTYTALAIASGLGERIALFDSESGSAALYANDFNFEIDDECVRFPPEVFIDAIDTAAREGFDVIILDSLSHAWSGRGGLLEELDKARGNNSFTKWSSLTPRHRAMIDAIKNAPIHVVAKMRSKTEYVIEQNSNGKQVPRKVGMKAVQRDDLDYEFDVIGSLDTGTLTVTKTRLPKFDGLVRKHVGKAFGEEIRDWLNSNAVEDTRDPMLDEDLTTALAFIHEGADGRETFEKFNLSYKIRPEQKEIIRGAALFMKKGKPENLPAGHPVMRALEFAPWLAEKGGDTQAPEANAAPERAPAEGAADPAPGDLFPENPAKSKLRNMNA